MKIIEKTYDWAYEYGRRERTDHIILHHAAAEKSSADDVHRWHLQNGWAGIGYNYFVRKDGSVYRGRPADAVGAHTIGYNSVSVGVCFEGNYQTEKTMPAEQLAAGKELVAYLKKLYPKAIVKKHKDFDATDCPGKYFPFAEISAAKATTAKKPPIALPTVKRGDYTAYVRIAQLRLKAKGYALATNGQFGSNTEAKVKKFQKKHKLTADGIVGSKTWAQLMK